MPHIYPLGSVFNTIQDIKNKKIDISKAISYASCEAACAINASAIVCSTLSGTTAKDISNYKPSCPLIAISPNSKIVRGLSINYGIIPMSVAPASTTDELVEIIEKELPKNIVEEVKCPPNVLRHINFNYNVNINKGEKTCLFINSIPRRWGTRATAIGLIPMVLTTRDLRRVMS